jgi:hypothetical protein
MKGLRSYLLEWESVGGRKLKREREKGLWEGVGSVGMNTLHPPRPYLHPSEIPTLKGNTYRQVFYIYPF